MVSGCVAVTGNKSITRCVEFYIIGKTSTFDNSCDRSSDSLIKRVQNVLGSYNKIPEITRRPYLVQAMRKEYIGNVCFDLRILYLKKKIKILNNYNISLVLP